MRISRRKVLTFGMLGIGAMLSDVGRKLLSARKTLHADPESPRELSMNGTAINDSISKAAISRFRTSRQGDERRLTGFGRPFGLFVDLQDALYVTDMDLHALFRVSRDRDTLQVLDELSGTWSEPHQFADGIATRGTPAEPGKLNGPHSVALGPDEKLYVTTYYSPGIHVFSPEGEPLRTIDGGSSGHCLSGPATAFFDRERRLLVSEYAQNALLAYDVHGTFLGALGRDRRGNAVTFTPSHEFAPSQAPGGFDRLHMCKQAPDGTLVVVDTWNHRLQRFSIKGEWLGWLGQDERRSVSAAWREETAVPLAGNKPGAFAAPVSVDFDPDGEQMVISDWGNNRLQFFTLEGKLLDVRNDLGLEKPYDACFCGDKFVVADSHHGMIREIARRI